MKDFENDSYTIIRNIIDTKKYANHIKSIEHLGQISDGQTENSIIFYEDSELTKLQKILQPKIEEISQMDLLRTYNYCRIYKPGAKLKPHSDRPACEISITLNLDGDDWAIGCFDYDNNAHEHILKPGDAMFYHGHDVTHWRPSTFKGKELIQAFFHYVNKNGPHAKQDKKEEINRQKEYDKKRLLKEIT